MKAALKKLQKLQEEMDSVLIERNVQVEATLAALIAGTNILLLGPPGTAKSLMARMVCNAIDNGNYFEWLLTKFSTPEEIFGPISFKGMKNDEYRRITQGKLPEAHYALLDEIFKANSAILNSMLTALNEHIFHNNGKANKIPLLSCIGASNELPQGEELGALYDRFPLKFWVEYIEDDDAFCALLEGTKGNSTPTSKITIDEIKKLQASVDDIPIDPEIIKTMRSLHHELKRKGVVASDRRWKAAVRIMKAYAMLRGYDKVTNDELEVLADVLWEKPEDRKTVYKVVAPKANPFNLKAVEFEDAAKEIYEKWKEDADSTEAAKEANGMLKEIKKSIEDEMQDRPPERTKKLQDVFAKVRRFQKEINDFIMDN